MTIFLGMFRTHTVSPKYTREISLRLIYQPERPVLFNEDYQIKRTSLNRIPLRENELNNESLRKPSYITHTQTVFIIHPFFSFQQ